MTESTTPTDVLSESVEMYLKTVFELGASGNYVPISALAAHLDISPVSATEMVHRLESEALFEHTPYRGVRLSSLGGERAQQVLRRHRLWECFLYDKLGLGWAEVHDLACALEHAVDQTVTEPLAEWLGQPLTCPHGNPVPYSTQAQAMDGIVLTRLEKGDTGEVMRIRPERADVLAYLDARGLRPGVQVTLVGREALDGTLVLAGSGGTVVVGENVAAHVVVHVGPAPEMNSE